MVLPRPDRQDDVSSRPMKQRRRLDLSFLSGAKDLLRHSVSHSDAVQPTFAETTANKDVKEDDEQEKTKEQKAEDQEPLVAGLSIKQSALQRNNQKLLAAIAGQTPVRQRFFAAHAEALSPFCKKPLYKGPPLEI